MKKISKERTGELMILGETITYAFFPIIIAYTTKVLPPILFAGISTLTASITLFFTLLLTKKLKTVFHWDTIKYTLGITIFIIIIPSSLIFTGSSMTSGINTTILLQSEILFTFIIFGLFRLEKITLQKVLGALIVAVGTTLIVFNNTMDINTGDLLIIAGTAFFPIGNFFAKKALTVATPTTILFIRSFLGGLVLISISLLFENRTNFATISKYWPIIILNGFLVFHLSKILWYEGIKRIDVSKAIPLSMGTFPVFSLILAVIFLNEIPTLSQLAGFFVVLAGIFTLIKKDKTLLPVGTE